MVLKRWTRFGSLTAALFCSACAFEQASLAPLSAQPNTPPARNFTSFSGALRCMDDMLVKAEKRRVTLSSTDIPDMTDQIDVGADDMLVNAIGHMNRKSKTYVFLDQGLVRDGGLIDLRVVAKRSPPRPDYYIRGSISQLDSKVMSDEVGADLDRKGNSGSGLLSGSFGRGRTVSVVSVDLHLVEFPSRRVVPGLSISNSMAVVSRGFGAGHGGLINLTTFDLSLEVDRIESNSQAVRNLIELGVIELLGRHSGLPYWQCLSDPANVAQVQSENERRFSRTSSAARLKEVQEILGDMGLYEGPTDGIMTPETRQAIAVFQDQEGLISSGNVDFDLLTALRKHRARMKRSAEAVTQYTASSHPTPISGSDDGFQNLYNFVN